MLTNKTTNEAILKMFRKAKRLVKAGEGAEAIQLITGAETAIRNSNIYFTISKAQDSYHLITFRAYANKIYSKLFCLLHDLKLNMLNGMTREALIKLDKIIATDIYGNYIQAKISRSDSKAEHHRKFRGKFAGGIPHNRLFIHLKGQM